MAILRANRALTEITGYSEQELIGHTPKIFQSGMHEKKLLCLHVGPYSHDRILAR